MDTRPQVFPRPRMHDVPFSAKRLFRGVAPGFKTKVPIDTGILHGCPAGTQAFAHPFFMQHHTDGEIHEVGRDGFELF